KNEAKIRKLAARYAARIGASVPPMEFRRVAILPEHIRQYRLITHDQKPSEATKNFPGSVAAEVEAMKPEDLQELLREALRALVSEEQLGVHVARDVALRRRMLAHMRRFRP